jgi:hypothetical protein
MKANEKEELFPPFFYDSFSFDCFAGWGRNTNFVLHIQMKYENRFR